MEHIRVLLIEDNPGDARLIREMLAEEKKVPFDMEWNDNLSKGLKRLAGGGIDVVLLDLNLPDSSGLDTFAKALSEAPQIPIIVMTGLDDETLAVGAVRKGAQDYLIKGHVDSRLLARAIRYAIERKQAEVKLRESEMRYHALFEQSPDGVLIIDPLSMIAIEFNKTAHRQLGYTREEFKHLRISDYEAKETPDETKYHILNVLREGKDEFETLHRTRNGELRNVFVTVQTIELSGKAVFHCIFHDITERKQAEEAIRESEHRSREMLQNIQLVGIMLDVDGNITFCNDYLLNLTGWHREEIIGRNWIKTFIPPERREESALVFQQLLSRGIPVQYESEIVTKKGDGHLISFNIVFLRDLRGNITGTASIGEDITVQRKAEAALKNYTVRLEETNRLKDLFTDIMHHDLLNPLGVIKLATDIPPSEIMDKGMRNTLLTIKRNTDKLIDMTRSAGAYAKLESAEKMEMSKLDLNEMFRAVVNNFKSQLEEKNMKLEYLSKDECYAMVNPIFETVFSNLLSNAIKYSPQGKKIEVNITGDSEYWRIYVKDWGYGIKEEDKAKLFTRFERVDKKGVKGTGLGLAIVKRIVELHGGRVWIEDNPEGGSVFYVEIPKMEK